MAYCLSSEVLITRKRLDARLGVLSFVCQDLVDVYFEYKSKDTFAFKIINLMKALSLSLFLAAAVSLQASAQTPTWIHDTIATGTGYKKNVYYSLENGTAGIADADNWHIGFSTGTFEEGVLTNSADKAIKLYEISSNPLDFGTDLTAAFNTAVAANPMPFYNSNTIWNTGAFNQGSAMYGWGDYISATHWIEGVVVFGLVTATDTFQVFIEDKQTYQVPNAPVFNFKIAQLDGSQSISRSIALGVTGYKDRAFVYYNIETDSFINREPAKSSWDFVFTNYNDENVVMGNEYYKVFGILNNSATRAAKVDTADAEFDNIIGNYASYTYDSTINSIGRKWKASGMSGVQMVDSLCYFVKVRNGDVWQLVFTASNSGAHPTDPGMVAMKKRKVYKNTTSVADANNAITVFTAFPNPTNNSLQVVFESAQPNSKNTITLTDMTGRKVYSNSLSAISGLQTITIPTASLANGNYILSVVSGGHQAIEKIVVHH